MAQRGWAVKRGWGVVLMDVVALIVALNVFALFHHVLPVYLGSAKKHIVSVSAPSPVATAAPAAEAAASQAPKPSYPPGDFSATFPGYDTGYSKTLSYQSDDVRIAIDQIQKNEVTGYVADIWIRNISFFRTAFARDQYGRGLHEMPLDIADRVQAILAISGDYYGSREKGVVIRNGDLYRDTVIADTCVLFADGTMEVYPKESFNVDQVVAQEAYQAWSFGPNLLVDGKAPESFDSEVTGLNPRSALGYYEPGHYCFVVIDGRQPGYSKGATLPQLAQLFESLGCKEAYNLDGGKSAMMTFQGNVVSQPYDGGRKISDILYIGGLPQ
jgi:exopolysaccharide biosynthesis protein